MIFKRSNLFYLLELYSSYNRIFPQGYIKIINSPEKCKSYNFSNINFTFVGALAGSWLISGIIPAMILWTSNFSSTIFSARM